MSNGAENSDQDATRSPDHHDEHRANIDFGPERKHRVPVSAILRRAKNAKPAR
jgi:hypothetical protein